MLLVQLNLTIFKLEPTTSNMSQHIATRWPNARNMLRLTLLPYVAIVWPGLKGPPNEKGTIEMFLLILFIFADGTQFSPGVTERDMLYAFSPEVCR